jgi:hypothetical protein
MSKSKSIDIPSSSGILEKTRSPSVFNDSTSQRLQYTPACSKGYQNHIKIFSKSSQISKCIKSHRNHVEKQAFLRRNVGICLSVWAICLDRRFAGVVNLAFRRHCAGVVWAWCGHFRRHLSWKSKMVCNPARQEMSDASIRFDVFRSHLAIFWRW